MTETTERAARAERLRGDDAFQEFMNAVRKKQVGVFLNAAATEEARSEAHAIVRALAAIEGELAAAIGAASIEQKRKDRHRADDR